MTENILSTVSEFTPDPMMYGFIVGLAYSLLTYVLHVTAKQRYKNNLAIIAVTFITTAAITNINQSLLVVAGVLYVMLVKFGFTWYKSSFEGARVWARLEKDGYNTLDLKLDSDRIRQLKSRGYSNDEIRSFAAYRGSMSKGWYKPMKKWFK